MPQSFGAASICACLRQSTQQTSALAQVCRRPIYPSYTNSFERTVLSRLGEVVPENRPSMAALVTTFMSEFQRLKCFPKGALKPLDHSQEASTRPNAPSISRNSQARPLRGSSSAPVHDSSKMSSFEVLPSEEVNSVPRGSIQPQIETPEKRP